jgi:hypothetical protein
MKELMEHARVAAESLERHADLARTAPAGTDVAVGAASGLLPHLSCPLRLLCSLPFNGHPPPSPSCSSPHQAMALVARVAAVEGSSTPAAEGVPPLAFAAAARGGSLAPPVRRAVASLSSLATSPARAAAAAPVQSAPLQRGGDVANTGASKGSHVAAQQVISSRGPSFLLRSLQQRLGIGGEGDGRKEGAVGGGTPSDYHPMRGVPHDPRDALPLRNGSSAPAPSVAPVSSASMESHLSRLDDVLRSLMADTAALEQSMPSM